MKDLSLNIKNIDIEKNWNIALDNNPVNEIKVLLKKEDLEKGMQSLRDLNLWCLEQITTKQNSIMFI